MSPFDPEDVMNHDDLPEPPDLEKVHALRRKIRADKGKGGDHHRTPLHDRFDRDSGKAARDIGSYTLIPTMMLAGPVMGYLVGHYAEVRLGGEPWLGVGGLMFGLAAAVRQIVLMLQKKNPPSDHTEGP